MKRAGLLSRSQPSDRSAEVLETRGEFEEALLQVEQEEDDPPLEADPLAGDADALLATVLCSAYPGNIAMRSNDRNFKSPA